MSPFSVSTFLTYAQYYVHHTCTRRILCHVSLKKWDSLYLKQENQMILS